jgi:hypothetical protein
MLVHRGGSVVGCAQLVDRKAASRPTIRVSAIREFVNEAGKGVRDVAVEATARADSEGVFRFDNVSPGKKRLRILWEEEGGHFFFATLPFDLPDGEDIDLGVIYANQGFDVEAIVELADAAGHPMDPALVWPSKPPPACRLYVSARPESRNPGEAVGEAIVVSLNDAFSLHGLPRGSLRLASIPLGQHRDWGDRVHSDDRIIPPKGEALNVEVPSVERASLRYRLERTGRVAFSIRFPTGITPLDAEIWIANSDGEWQTAVDVPAAEEGVRVVRNQRGSCLPSGSYDLFAHVDPSSDYPVGGAAWYAVARIQVLGDGLAMDEVVLDMLEGARVSGVLVDESGAAMQDFVWIRFGPWTGASPGSSPFVVFTDSEGRFDFPGVPPGMPFEMSDGARGIAPGAGSTISLTVRRQRQH